MDNDAPVLYQYWQSSSSWRVRWALLIKGIACRHVVVDLRQGEQDLPAHRQRSPIGAVPALVFPDGRTLTESIAILEYLEETVPTPPLYPRDPWARARTRQLVELINAGIQPLQNLAVLKRVSPERGAQVSWAAHFNQRGLTAVETLLDRIAAELPGRFSVGDTLTAADLCLVPQLASARRFGVDVTAFPRALAVEQAALDTDHAAQALPASQPGAPTSAP